MHSDELKRPLFDSLARCLTRLARASPELAAARKSVSMEVDANLDRLRTFWAKQRPHQSEDEIHRVDKIRYARNFVAAPLPPFQRTAYKSEKPLLAKSLLPAEFARLEQLYLLLTQIEELHQELRDALESDLAARQSSASADVGPIYCEFLGIAAKCWSQAAYLMEEASSRGNPLVN